MDGGENSVRVLRFLEPPHSFEPCIDVTDVRLQPIRCRGDTMIDEVGEGVAEGLLEAPEDVVVDGVDAKGIHGNEALQVLPPQGTCVR